MTRQGDRLERTAFDAHASVSSLQGHQRARLQGLLTGNNTQSVLLFNGHSPLKGNACIITDYICASSLAATHKTSSSLSSFVIHLKLIFIRFQM